MQSQEVTKTGLRDVGQRARRRVADRLLPLVFLLYIISYIRRGAFERLF